MVKRKRRKSGREFYCVLGSKKTQKDTSNNRYNSWDCANGKAKPWPGYVCAGCKAFTCNDCAEKLLNVISATCAKSPRGPQYADTDSVCIGIRNALAGGQVNEPSLSAMLAGYRKKLPSSRKDTKILSNYVTRTWLEMECCGFLNFAFE